MLNIDTSKILTPTYLATIYLVTMITNIAFIEGFGVSPLKVVLMGIAVPIFALVYRYPSRAVWTGGFYVLSVLVAAYSQSYVRFSTIGYLGMFVITYMLFYNLVYIYEAFDITYFHRLTKVLLITFGVVLIIQQICTLIGLHFLPFINLNGNPIDKLPILTAEPSHTARVLGALMLAYLKISDILKGEHITLKDMISRENIAVSGLFLWMIFTMGSGTGFVVLAIVSLYFIRKETLIFILPLFLILYLTAPMLHMKQIDRVVSVVNASLTGSNDVVIKADNSAAVRVSPIINTLTNTDLSDPDMWFGKGTLDEVAQEKSIHHMEDQRIGNINQYGIICFIFSLFVVFGCCIRNFLSLETLLFAVVLGCGINNIYYIWGCLMIFTCIRYFEEQYIEVEEQE